MDAFASMGTTLGEDLKILYRLILRFCVVMDGLLVDDLFLGVLFDWKGFTGLLLLKIISN